MVCFPPSASADSPVSPQQPTSSQTDLRQSALALFIRQVLVSPSVLGQATQPRRLTSGDRVRDDELDAARATNRELMTRLNRSHPDGCNH